MLNEEDKINKKIGKMIAQDANNECGSIDQCEDSKEQAFKLQENYKQDLQCDDPENCG